MRILQESSTIAITDGMGQEVYGSTIGIVGLGRIGFQVARRAKGFDMEVLYHGPSQKLVISISTRESLFIWQPNGRD